MSIADCTHDWNPDPTVCTKGGVVAMRCSRCAALAIPAEADPKLAVIHAPEGSATIDWLEGSTSVAGIRDEMVKRGAHVCREDIEAEDARPRCATCGQFVAFRPLERGPDAWQAKAIERIRRERLRQDAKWGEQNHDPDRWALILTEETGEVAKAALERDHKAYIAELVQVAAVALAALECAARGAGATEEA